MTLQSICTHVLAASILHSLVAAQIDVGRGPKTFDQAKAYHKERTTRPSLWKRMEGRS